MHDDGVGVCDDGYFGMNDGFCECDISTGGGAGEDDGDGEDVEDGGASEDDGEGEDVDDYYTGKKRVESIFDSIIVFSIVACDL